MQRKTEKRDEERKQTRTYRRTESEGPRRRRTKEGRGGGREGTENGKGTRGHIERFERRLLGGPFGARWLRA
jgi:hypothetical protein